MLDLPLYVNTFLAIGLVLLLMSVMGFAFLVEHIKKGKKFNAQLWLVLTVASFTGGLTGLFFGGVL